MIFSNSLNSFSFPACMSRLNSEIEICSPTSPANTEKYIFEGCFSVYCCEVDIISNDFGCPNIWAFQVQSRFKRVKRPKMPGIQPIYAFDIKMLLLQETIKNEPYRSKFDEFFQRHLVLNFPELSLATLTSIDKVIHSIILLWPFFLH